jgi:hypothetical protein
LFAAFSPLGAAPPQTPDTSQSKELRKLIASLTARDPAERDRAETRLAFLGPVARPALLEAIRHPDIPELRSRAAHALLRIPCDAPTDSPAVRQILREYASSDPAKRAEAIVKFGVLDSDDSAFPALLRVMAYEPSNEVLWLIAAQLRRFTDDPHLRIMRAMESTADNAPSLVLAGWAWMGTDVPRGTRLLARALKLESQDPSTDDPALDWAFYRVYENAIVRREYDAAADVLRESAWRGNPDAETSPQLGGIILSPGAQNNVPPNAQPEPSAAPDDDDDALAPPGLLALFVLHAQVGPLRGFERDLQIYQDYLAQPEMLYAIGHAYERSGQRLMAQAYARAAFAASGASGETRDRVAEFLIAHGWYDQAQRECTAAIGIAGPNQLAVDATALFTLSHIIGNTGDDARAAQLLQSAIDRLKQAGAQVDDRNLARYAAEREWRLLRDARTRKDADAITTQLGRLAPEEALANPEVAIDVILALRETHHSDEAARIFESSYADLKQHIAAYPPEPILLNALAWLCARCNEHLDEALDLATTATQIAGGDGAFIDTAAEANFRAGHAAEAVRLETQALIFQPGDVFMQAQLKHYRGE